VKDVPAHLTDSLDIVQEMIVEEEVVLRITNKSALSLLLAVFFLTISTTFVGCSSTVKESESDMALEADDNASSEQVVNHNDNQAREIIPTATPEASNRPINDQSDRDGDQIKRETRAIWSWKGTKATSRDEIDELVAKVDAAHLNVILLLVYAAGTARFEPSHTRFDSNERLPNMSAFAEDGYSDALSYLLAIRDARRADDDPFNDFEVHAWVAVHSGSPKGKEGEDTTEPHMLHAIFPEFKLKQGRYYRKKEDKRYVEHHISVVHQPKFRAYMADLIAGLVEDYDIDGVHLDYIRTGKICFNNEPLDYPGTEYDYPGCQEDYRAWTRETYGREYTLWEDTNKSDRIQDGGSGRVAAWLESRMGLLVKQIHDEVKLVRPDVVISVAAGYVSPEERKQSIQGQVAWEWLDQGWIDAVFVMDYTPNTQWAVDKIQRFRDLVQNESKKSRVFPGLRTYTHDDTEDLWSYLVEEQVNAVMRGQWDGQPLEPPAKGMSLYVDRRLSEEAIEALANGPFKEPAMPFWGEIE
jgi:uncharacterized lipoprotein YddW (UPF0748 family)